MAVPTTFSGAKLEALLLKSASSSSSASSSRASSASHFSLFSKPIKNRRTLIQKRVIRCEADSDVVFKTDEPSIGNAMSALEQLKTSAADSKFCSQFPA